MKINQYQFNSSFQLPYIIAEVGVNHEGDFNKAVLMIEEAAKAGANAVKFQSYKAETLASVNSPSYWDRSKEPTESQYKLFKKYDQFNKEDYQKLAKICRENSIDFMSTPFSSDAVEFLNPLVPAHKIASADITNLPLLRQSAQSRKELILSTGASSLSEIWQAVEAIKEAGGKQPALLHCILNYPTAIENANLAMIKDLKKKFPGFIIGYSDHCLAEYICEVFSTAWLFGAQIIEKHFTFNKTLPGNDHYHAMDKYDLKKAIYTLQNIKKLVGQEEKQFLKTEIISRKNARRSIVAACDIPKGSLITPELLIPKRPGTGLSPLFIDEIISKKATRNIKKDELLNLGDFTG